jgi:hypothetical protein
MKTRCFLLPVAFLALLTLTASSAYSQTTVTFDDLDETGSGAFFSTQYQGLTWNNILCNNAILETGILARLTGTGLSNGLTGDFYGMVSASNVAVMIGGNELSPNSEIDSPGTNFDFFSAYLTGREDSNLNIEVQGFQGTNLVYDQTVVASATNATLFTFNFLNIDRLYFSSYGGEAAFSPYSDPGTFIMDNFTFEFVPEPSSLLLAALGGVSLVAFLRRKRP